MCGGSGRPDYWRRSVPPTVDVNSHLRDKLRDFNDRDTEAIQRHLRGLRQALERDVEDVIRPLFGGSISRNTYVDGLSDVDVLMVINDSTLVGQSPQQAIQRMAELIRQRMPSSDVSTGRMAVTIRYSDGIEMQILPAIRTHSGIRVPEAQNNRWSNVVHPERFARKLTQVNGANGGQVVPTIKLIKAVLNRATQSDRGRLHGYHIESLAIEAFKDYRGSHDLTSMLSRFFTMAPNLVQRPITDPTGQSRQVDTYLGPQGSVERQRASANLRQVKRNLDACRTTRDLDNLFDIG